MIPISVNMSVVQVNGDVVYRHVVSVDSGFLPQLHDGSVYVYVLHC